MNYPQPIKNLIEQFSQLPTVGPKTAERYVFYLLKKSPEEINKFAKELIDLKNNITICQNCYSITESNPCQICSNTERDRSVLCVVADTRDMLVIEQTKTYNGLYYILGGTINTIEEIGPEKLNIQPLIQKIKNSNNSLKEILLALNPNLEGETTSMYLNKLLKNYNLKITRLAKGMPIGSDLEYADEMTVINALKYRNEL